ncbi:alkyl hydroperoxide reductase [Burkholderia pseudomallei]|nr:alkyl hydroperoxide reductase [Burkholderia pseudomallei]
MKKRFTEEQIIGILTEAEAGLDLPPTNRASRSLVKFVFGEEDEHEEERWSRKFGQTGKWNARGLSQR